METALQDQLHAYYEIDLGGRTLAMFVAIDPLSRYSDPQVMAMISRINSIGGLGQAEVGDDH